SGPLPCSPKVVEARGSLHPLRLLRSVSFAGASQYLSAGKLYPGKPLVDLDLVSVPELGFAFGRDGVDAIADDRDPLALADVPEPTVLGRELGLPASGTGELDRAVAQILDPIEERLVVGPIEGHQQHLRVGPLIDGLPVGLGRQEQVLARVLAAAAQRDRGRLRLAVALLEALPAGAFGLGRGDPTVARDHSSGRRGERLERLERRRSGAGL